jgi:hypothetical protein
MKYYSGVGMRKTPTPMLEVLKKIAKVLAKKGYTLRSGGAEGADSAFEEGCIEENGTKEIYLPWVGFQNKQPNHQNGYYCTKDHPELYEGYQLAKNLSKTIHPIWNDLPESHKLLHTRNVHQVLGLDAKTPSAFLVCYTSDPEKGGTAQAIRVAKYMDVPVYNMADNESAASFLKLLKIIQEEPTLSKDTN